MWMEWRAWDMGHGTWDMGHGLSGGWVIWIGVGDMDGVGDMNRI